MKLPKLKIKNKLFVTLTTVAVFSIIGIATAQELQRTFTVINPQISAQINPGQRSEGTTQVINQSNVPLTFKVSTQDYTVSDTKGTPSLLPPSTLNNKYSAAAWIAIYPEIFTLKPAQKETLNYVIQAPGNASPGGHYAALVYQPVVQNTTNATGGVVNTQIGSLFYVTVNGPVHEQAQVTKFFANAFQEYGPVNILTQIKNLGDLHINPKGAITVSGLFANNKVLPLDSHNIFPGGVARDYQNSFNGAFLIGRYKAELLASYGVNNNLPLSASIYFWVFPWRLVVVVILIILAIILGVAYFRKRKKNHPKAAEEPKTEHTETHKETEEEAKS